MLSHEIIETAISSNTQQVIVIAPYLRRGFHAGVILLERTQSPTERSHTNTHASSSSRSNHIEQNYVCSPYYTLYSRGWGAATSWGNCFEEGLFPLRNEVMANCCLLLGPACRRLSRYAGEETSEPDEKSHLLESPQSAGWHMRVLRFRRSQYQLQGQ